MKQFYLSGPMRGYPESNYPLFYEIEDALNFSDVEKDEPIEILNPAQNFDGDPTLDLALYFSADLYMILACDAVVLLPGWPDSEGSVLEVQVSRMLGKEFWVAERNMDDLGWTFTQIDAGDLYAHARRARKLSYQTS